MSAASPAQVAADAAAAARDDDDDAADDDDTDSVSTMDSVDRAALDELEVLCHKNCSILLSTMSNSFFHCLLPAEFLFCFCVV